MLNRAQQALHNVTPLIAKAEKCGVNCEEYRKGWHHIATQIADFKREFFPGVVVPPDGSGVQKNE